MSRRVYGLPGGLGGGASHVRLGAAFRFRRMARAKILLYSGCGSELLLEKRVLAQPTPARRPSSSKETLLGSGVAVVAGMAASPSKLPVVPVRPGPTIAAPVLVLSVSTAKAGKPSPPYRVLPSNTIPPICGPPVGPTSVAAPVVVFNVYKLAALAKYNVLEFVDRV